MPPRRPRSDETPEQYAERLTQIGMLRGQIPEGESGARASIDEPELVPMPEGSGPDFAVEGGEEVAAPVAAGGGATEPATSDPPPLPVLPPIMPQAIDPASLSGQVIASLRQQGIAVDDGVIQGSIQNMFRNIQIGKVDPGTTVEQVVGTAIRMNMRHQAAEYAAMSHEAATRSQVMAEPKVPWRHERRFKCTLNGWVMLVPANQSVLVPKSIYEILQHAIMAEVIVKNMQQEMYFRMTGIPTPTEDPHLYEGYDDHHMRRVAYQN